MSNMKCPFCNGKLYGCIGHPYCRNEKCEMCDEMMPQELLDLLERTRKALDLAIRGLETVHMANSCITKESQIAYEYIKEIKQLIKD